ncbi:hypothetical protein CSV69_12975 [Sporosarcina sp. P26b]|nr:hypothetical protein CSV76_06505 [Sporosarcina sp. P17b]PIC95184.1 hypothetical protein CSV69_12975 [Sporosarcina sp. P26b]
MVAKCKDVLLTLRFYSQKPFFATALPDGSARKMRQPKGSLRPGRLTESPWESVRQLELPSPRTHKFIYYSKAIAFELK